MAELKRKIALVAGGSSGIGLATAKRFVDEGDASYLTGTELFVDDGFGQV